MFRLIFLKQFARFGCRSGGDESSMQVIVIIFFLSGLIFLIQASKTMRYMYQSFRTGE
jgi:hypothetical protein